MRVSLPEFSVKTPAKGTSERVSLFLCQKSPWGRTRGRCLLYVDEMPVGDSYDDEFISDGLRIVRRQSGPCLVCGHPTGDCSEGSNNDVRILGANLFPSLNIEDVFIVEEDIFEERQISQFSKIKVLTIPAGTRITKTKAKELGLV